MTKKETASTALDVTYNEDNWNKTTDAEANNACPNNDPFVTMPGLIDGKKTDIKWWTNFWWSKTTGTYVWGGDDPNMPQYDSNFDPKQFYEKTSVGVKLKVKSGAKSDDPWITSELVLGDILGYGHYVVTAKAGNGSFGSLDPHVVFGIFTYQWGEADPAKEKNTHREIDMLETIAEMQQNLKGNAQFTLQPAFALPDHQLIHRYTVPDTEYVTAYMHRVDPAKNNNYIDLQLRLYAGNYSYDDIMRNQPQPINGANWWLAKESNYPFTSDYIPKHTDQSCERMHINFYIPNGRKGKGLPAGPQEVTLTRFEFQS